MCQPWPSQRHSILPHDRGSRSDPRQHPPRTPIIDLHLPLILKEPPAPILPFDSFLPCHANRKQDGHAAEAKESAGSGRARDNAGRHAEAGGRRAQAIHDSNSNSERGARLEAAIEDMTDENEVRKWLIFRVRRVWPVRGYHG
ncbi:hypothetical protein IFM61606_02196 [Aspergillus udagawae]|nr:hypothetical protein IFM61606_02196 [Aspergillus udagawae]